MDTKFCIRMHQNLTHRPIPAFRCCMLKKWKSLGDKIASTMNTLYTTGTQLTSCPACGKCHARKFYTPHRPSSFLECKIESLEWVWSEDEAVIFNPSTQHLSQYQFLNRYNTLMQVRTQTDIPCIHWYIHLHCIRRR